MTEKLKESIIKTVSGEKLQNEIAKSSRDQIAPKVENKPPDIESRKSPYEMENLSKEQITDEIIKEVTDAYNYIFCNDFPEYVVCSSCDMIPDRTARFSAKEIFETDEHVPIDQLYPNDNIPNCPCCDQKMQLFLDTDKVFEKLKEKLESEGCLTIARNSTSGEIMGFAFGYVDILKEYFNKEWKYYQPYMKEPNENHTRSFTDFMKLLKENNFDNLNEDTEIFGWNCIATMPKSRNFRVFNEITSNFFNSIPEHLIDHQIVGETIKTSALYSLIQASEASIIDEYFDEDYVLVVNSVQKFKDTFCKSLKDFIKAYKLCKIKENS